MSDEQNDPTRIPRRREPNVDRSHAVYEVDLWLMGSAPLIWRTLAIRSDTTLDSLHWIIQHAMDWDNAHLHDFQTPSGRTYEPKDPEFSVDMMWRQFRSPLKRPSEHTEDATVRDLFEDLKKGIIYRYDYGDNWEHGLRLVDTHEDESRFEQLAMCLDGRRAAPPEDCGGIRGFEEKLDILRDPDPRDPFQQDLLEWLGEDFDPERFDLARINRRLRGVRDRVEPTVTVRRSGVARHADSTPKRKRRKRRKNKRAKRSR